MPAKSTLDKAAVIGMAGALRGEGYSISGEIDGKPVVGVVWDPAAHAAPSKSEKTRVRFLANIPMTNGDIARINVGSTN